MTKKLTLVSLIVTLALVLTAIFSVTVFADAAELEQAAADIDIRSLGLASYHEERSAIRVKFDIAEAYALDTRIVEIGGVVRKDSSTSDPLEVDEDGNLLASYGQSKIVVFRDGVQVGNVLDAEDGRIVFTIYLYNLKTETKDNLNSKYSFIGYTIVEDSQGNRMITYTGQYSGVSYNKLVCLNTGHVWDEGVTTLEPTTSSEGTKLYTCERCGDTYTEAIPALRDVAFAPAFENTDTMLYRVGNANAVSLSKLYKETGSVEATDSLVSVTVEPVGSYATLPGGTVTANTSNWASGSIRFSGQGPVRVTLTDENGATYPLLLEVVNATNLTAMGSATNRNVVLLNDVNAGSVYTVSAGYTFYGNGFTVTDTRSSTSGTSGLINLTTGGSLDNVTVKGYEAENMVMSGVSNQEYAPIIKITGNANIYNSHISGGRYAVQAEGGKYVFDGVLLDGGALGNMELNSGDLTLKNCTTTYSTCDGLKGLGIKVSSPNCNVYVKGDFTQYNWLTKDSIPSSYTSVLSSVYKDANYAYTSSADGAAYVNMGIIFLSEASNMDTAIAQARIHDETGNDYGYVEKTFIGYTGTCYLPKSSMAGEDMLSAAPVPAPAQYYTLPATSFDFTNKNYIPNVAGSDNYCYYDSNAEKVLISFEENQTFSYDPMILTAVKYGQTLGYTVALDGTDVTGQTVNFTESGEHELVFTYVDPYNYDKDGVASTVTHSKTVILNVTEVNHDANVYETGFTYVGDWANSARKTIINNKTYVMPDVSATSDTIGSTTVNGQTVYFPIVTVGACAADGNTPYDRGQINYFAPAFSAINITDYDQSTGAVQYTYDTSSTTWPHGQSGTVGPDGDVFGYAANAAYANIPYGRSMNQQYYVFGVNNLGPCYVTAQIEQDNAASSHLVQFHYAANDGTIYYYYVRYNFEAATLNLSCFAEGTGITMADGTVKAIEDIKGGEQILAYDFFTGEYVAKDISLLVNHGDDLYKVNNLYFSDGTTLRTIGDHGVFDYDLNKFVYINGENYTDYIGHKFAKAGVSGTELVTLDRVEFTEEYVGCYSISSAGTSNAVAGGMLTVAPPEDFYNWIEMDGKMRYDSAKFAEDVATYGLYTYDDFKDYVTEEQFEQWNGAYLKIAVEKGLFTFDYIIELIGRYVQYMP